MSSQEPITGRCGARARGGGYCEAYPARGRGRCKNHGGASTGPAVTTGMRSKRLQALRSDPELAERLDAILEDPHVLEPRRGAALSQIAMEELPLRPSRSIAEAKVRRVLEIEPGRPLTPEEEEVVDEALRDIQGEYAERFVRAAGAHALTVSRAAKQERAAELLIRGALPIMRTLASRLQAIVARYLTPTQQAEVLQLVHVAMEDVKLELVRLGQASDGDE